jgi:glucosyl-dolichyl phosphate glucuronosyltransferase
MGPENQIRCATEPATARETRGEERQPIVQTHGRAPTVSVVVCAYTMARWALLGRALSSVRSQTRPALEILLVVDHCPDLLIRSQELGEGVHVLPNGGAPGLSGARNTGVAAARGEVVAFLDDDAVAAPDWLERLVRPYDDPRVVGVGGRVIAEWEGGRPAWFPQEFDWVVGCSYVGQPTVASAVRNPIGANMSFRRDALLAVGGFSVDVGRVGSRPVGCEETELSIRTARHDPTSVIVLEPRAVVGHHVPRDRSRWGYFWRRCWAEGLSKASVSRLTDPRSALSSERAYVARTLPRGAVRGMTDAVRRGESGGAARALAIGAGLTVTASGYAVGKAGRKTGTTLHPEEN